MNNEKILLDALRNMTDAARNLNERHPDFIAALNQSSRAIRLAEYAQCRIDCAEEKPVREMSDTEEYEAAHECGRMEDARALREGR